MVLSGEHRRPLFQADTETTQCRQSAAVGLTEPPEETNSRLSIISLVSALLSYLGLRVSTQGHSHPPPDIEQKLLM